MEAPLRLKNHSCEYGDDHSDDQPWQTTVIDLPTHQCTHPKCLAKTIEARARSPEDHSCKISSPLDCTALVMQL